MEFVVLLIIVGIMYLVLRFIFDFNMKKLKSLGENKELDELTKKYPNNIDICKYYLKKLNNESVNIEEDKDSNTTLFLVISNKIFIANLKDSYTRIQTIAHECLHSVQSKRLLWFNFVFSNIYLIYFFIVCALGVFRVLPYKMLFLSILILFGLVFYAVRVYLENDAMIKARFLAEDYMKELNISSQEEIERIVSSYDVINNIGIRCINFNLLSNVFFKIFVLLIIAIAF